MSRIIQRILAAIIVVAGLAIATVRVTFPNADRYRDDLQAWLSELAGRPVAIGQLQAHWRGWQPEILIRDVRLRGSDDFGRHARVIARFDHAAITVDLLASLLRGDISPYHIRLGELSLSAGDDPPGSGGQLGAVLDWLLRQQRLNLSSARLALTNLNIGGGPPVVLEQVHLSVRNAGSRHTLEAAGMLPAGKGGVVTASAVLSGDPRSDSWSGDVGVSLSNLDLEGMASAGLRLEGLDAAGRVSLALQSAWKRGTVQTADLDVRLDGFRVASAAGETRPLRREGRVRLLRQGEGWSLRLEQPRRRLIQFRDPPAVASLQIADSDEEGLHRIRGEIARLSVEELLPLLPAATAGSERSWQRLRKAAPRGRIENLAFELEGSEAGIESLRVQGDLRGINSRALRDVPSLVDMNASFVHDHRGTRIVVAGGAVKGLLTNLFTDGLAGRDVAGEMLIYTEGENDHIVLSNLRMRTRAVREMRVSGEVLFTPADNKPNLDILVGVSDANMAHLSEFLPTGVFGRNASRWILGAFPSGNLSAATVEIRGRGSQDAQIGEDIFVNAHARVNRTRLLYAHGWPAIRDLTSDLHLADRRFSADVHAGAIYDTRIQETRVVIPDIRDPAPVLTVSGRVEGTTEEATRFLRESPLHDRLRVMLDNLDAHGPSTLDLELGVPLYDAQTEVSGTLTVVNNDLGIPSLREGFRDLAGSFRFDRNGFDGEGVTGTYQGRPINVAVKTLRDDPPRIHVRLSGNADATYVARHLHNAGLLGAPKPEALPLLTRLEGETAWEALIDVYDEITDDGDRVKLTVRSDLQGVDVGLPAPFDKKAREPLEVSVEALFGVEGERRMRVEMGSLASGRFLLEPVASGFSLKRGGVHFGIGPAVLPDRDVLVVGGRIERLDLRDASTLLFSARPGARRTGNVLSAKLKVDVAHLQMLGGDFNDVHVVADRASNGAWTATLRGGDIHADLVVPRNVPQEPVVATFEGLALGGGENGDHGLPTDPRAIPPVRFTCNRCTLKSLPLKWLQVVTSHQKDGLRFDDIRVGAEGFDASASGAWIVDGGQHRTRFSAQVHSQRLGTLLSSFGYERAATTGGATDVTLMASWRGAPTQFHLRDLNGLVHFYTREGTLMDVERGATGRMFGLLIVTDLPRRLKGDFSDLFDEGFTYDHMEGTFTIENGNAYTNNLTMESSTARIDIAGRTGLVAEDYDQLVTVTPKLSTSLPLAPIWLVEKVFRKQVFDKVFAYQYTITGSWDAPSINRIGNEPELDAEKS